MVQKAGSDAVKEENLEIHRLIIEDLALLVTPTESKQRPITAAQQVVLKAIGKTSVLVSAQAADLVEVLSYNTVAQNRACMKRKRIMDVYPGCSSYITIVKFGKVDVYLPKNQKVGEVLNALSKIAQIKDKR